MKNATPLTFVGLVASAEHKQPSASWLTKNNPKCQVLEINVQTAASDSDFDTVSFHLHLTLEENQYNQTAGDGGTLTRQRHLFGN